MDKTSLQKRLKEPGPKRLLALDGGGIRGLITLGYLARIEQILRKRYNAPDLVLCDYFDLIGGTSTGAILAATLTLGWSVEKIRRMYLTLSKDTFQPRKNWFGPLGRLLGAKFDEKPLEKILKTHLGDRTLDSSDLRVGIMIISKRIDTGSVWVLVNLPDNKFYDLNRAIPLWEVVRSSTAAPTFFTPRTISDVGKGENAVFIDGAISTHLNPALQLLMVATLKGFGLQWPLGEEQLLVCSLGTGNFHRLIKKEEAREFSNLHWMALLTGQLMQDSSELNRTILQWMSRSPTAEVIDQQIETMENDCLTEKPLLSYLRYNINLEKKALMKIGMRFTSREVESLKSMSNVKNIADLDSIGIEAAEQHIKAEHFPRAFDRLM